MGRAELTANGDPTVAEFERIVEVCDRFDAQWRRRQRRSRRRADRLAEGESAQGN
jgi:hypothetical protein